MFRAAGVPVAAMESKIQRLKVTVKTRLNGLVRVSPSAHFKTGFKSPMGRFTLPFVPD